jgi:hypothetical protein
MTEYNPVVRDRKIERDRCAHIPGYEESRYSSTLKTEYVLYHEVIHKGDIDVAKVIGYKDGTYGYILDHNMSCSRGYKSVADCKQILFEVLDDLV